MTLSLSWHRRYKGEGKSMIGLFRLLVVVIAGMGSGYTVRGDVPDAEQLAQRFRPYYKFSVDEGNSQEPCRPCSWEWFAAHSKLMQGDIQLLSKVQLAKDPKLFLSVPDGNILRTKKPTAPLALRPDNEAYAGEPWKNIVDTGAGIYAQVEDASDNFVVITYWTLFGYNRATVLRDSYDHEGDIIAVTVVYDRVHDQLVRAAYGLHGRVLELFNIALPQDVRERQLTGRNINGGEESVSAKVFHVSGDRAYEDGPYWHSPAGPTLYLVQDPQTGRFEHLAAFCEWGSHEPWPNTNGSTVGAPKHGGNGVSFLPKRVRLLGSFATPAASEAPFVLFNGVWGNDPKGIIFHKACFYPEGREQNHFKIPVSEFQDRDPFHEGTLHWPPLRPVHIRITASCSGRRNEAQLAIRWGHPDYDENEYFKLHPIKVSETLTWEFDTPDRISEFEIQTEGGTGTGYSISIQINRGHAPYSEIAPNIRLQHFGAGNVKDEDVVTGGVGITRSSKLNRYGEQNFRVDVDGDTRGQIH